MDMRSLLFVQSACVHETARCDPIAEINQKCQSANCLMGSGGVGLWRRLRCRERFHTRPVAQRWVPFRIESP